MHSLDPTYPLFPICSFLAFILPLIPLPWHLKAWNSGLCYYIFWTSLASLNLFINSVVWASDAINRAPIFCDISIRISAGASIGIPAASLCIVKRLYTISTVQSAQTTRAEKRRVVLIDSLICILFPLIIVALQTIVLGHRFDILEGAGCIPAVYNTHLTYFIFSMWPAVIGFISAIYCVLTLLAFRRRQMEFNQYLRNSTSLTISRYFRLMALVTTETLFTVPLTLFTIILSVKQAPPNPWISWEETHYDFWRVEQYPAILWRSNFFVVVGTELSRWVVPLCAFIFFAFFGFAEEARKNYNEAFLAASKFTKLDRVFTKLRPVSRDSKLKPFALKGSVDTDYTLPVYSPPAHPMQKGKRPSSTTSTVIVIQHDSKSSTNFDYPPSPTSSTVPSYYEMMHTPTSSTFCPSSSSNGGVSPTSDARHTTFGSVMDSEYPEPSTGRRASFSSSTRPRAV